MVDIILLVKEKVSIMDVVNKYCRGSPDNKGFIYSPFKRERTASCRIYRETNSFYDFGSGTGGDTIKLVARMYNVTNVEAARIIAKDFGIQIEEGEKQKAVAGRQRQQDFEKYAIYLTMELNIFYQNIADKFKYFDEILQKIGNYLKPDDELLKELITSKNNYETLCHDFIQADFKGRYNLYTKELNKNAKNAV